MNNIKPLDLLDYMIIPGRTLLGKSNFLVNLNENMVNNSINHENTQMEISFDAELDLNHMVSRLAMVEHNFKIRNDV